ncbi:MAG: CvpA family protein [Schleiferilactobacillus perolens]|uniref:CvpA family protein n=1 Tax=Schleiferilactobacillus perolens TaxID=100468 RepID=UPI0039EC230F
MLSVLLFLLLLYGIYGGARRGVYLQACYTVGYLLAGIAAMLGYRALGPHLDLWIPYPSASMQSFFAFFTTKVGLDLDQPYYNACAFLIIFAVGWLVVRCVMLWFTPLQFMPVPNTWNSVGGMVLGFLSQYTFLFIVVYFVALIPIDGMQHALSHSLMSRMLMGTPGLSQLFTHLWVGQI